MTKEVVFKKYDLNKKQNDDVEFKIFEMPDFFNNNGNAPMQPHIHSFYQIIWYQKGNGNHYVDFKSYPIKDNTLFFISPGQIHYFDNNKKNIGYIIHFNESFMSDETSSENVFLKYNVFNAFDTVPFYNIEESKVDRLNYIMEEMKIETENIGSFAHKDYLTYLVKMFLIYIQRIGNRGSGTPLCVNNSLNRLFVQFRLILEQNYKKIHSVKEYANLLNVSTKTLTNSVLESSNSTPLKIINDRIILEAKRQLKHSSLQIKEIAFQLGFEDPSYFVKFFKRETGTLPSKFRFGNFK